jgi:hypothetical protein
MHIFYVLPAGGDCIFRALVFALDTKKTQLHQAKKCEEQLNSLIFHKRRCLSSKCYYKRRSSNVLCQNIGYFEQRWEYVQFMPSMKGQFGFVADFVEVNCKGN